MRLFLISLRLTPWPGLMTVVRLLSILLVYAAFETQSVAVFGMPVNALGLAALTTWILSLSQYPVRRRDALQKIRGLDGVSRAISGSLVLVGAIAMFVLPFLQAQSVQSLWVLHGILFAALNTSDFFLQPSRHATKELETDWPDHMIAKFKVVNLIFVWGHAVASLVFAFILPLSGWVIFISVISIMVIYAHAWVSALICMADTVERH